MFLPVAVLIFTALCFSQNTTVLQHSVLPPPANLGTNPAWLARNSGWNYAVFIPSSDEQPRYIQLSGGLGNAEFTYGRESFGPGLYSQKYWEFASGSNLGETDLGLRARYAKRSNDPDYHYAIDAGLLFHPLDFATLGYQIKDLYQSRYNRSARQQLGLGLEISRWIEVAAEAEQSGLTRYRNRNIKFRYGGSLKFPFGVYFSAFTDLAKNPGGYQLSLGMNLSPQASLHFASASRKTPGVFGFSGHSTWTPRYMSYPQTVHLNFNRKMSDSPSGFSMKSGPEDALDLKTFWENRRWLLKDPYTRSVVADLSYLECGLSGAEEIRRLFLDLRKKGIKVTAYLENINNMNYYAATAADQIAVHPAAFFNVPGLSMEVFFFKNALSRWGINSQFVRHGRYKSAVEPWTEDSMSADFRANSQQLLDNVWQHLVHEISLSRNIPEDSLQQWFKRPRLDLKRAQSFGLIDTLMYREEISRQQLFPDFGIYDIAESKKNHAESWRSRPKIGLIVAQGAIVSGEGGSIFGQSSQIGSSRLSRELSWYRHQNDIHAVVIRINSPGGSALASDELWKQVQLLKESGKAVIISVGSAAASGGYYIACAGDYIVAEPTSIVGSIGIFAGKISLNGLYNKIGLKKEIVKTGSYADAQSESRPFSPEELEALQNHMDQFYHGFVAKVAAGRGKTWNQTDSLAQGKVYTGIQAKELGLVDQLGGLEAALKMAAQKSGLTPDKEFELITREQIPLNFWEEKTFGSSQWVPQMMNWLNSLENEEIWMLDPMVL